MEIDSKDQQQTGTRIAIGGRELVDGVELARRLGVARTTVWRLARLRRIGRYTIGRRWFYCEAEVLDALRVPPVA